MNAAVTAGNQSPATNQSILTLSVEVGKNLQSRLPGGAGPDHELAQPVSPSVPGDPPAHQVSGHTQVLIPTYSCGGRCSSARLSASQLHPKQIAAGWRRAAEAPDEVADPGAAGQERLGEGGWSLGGERLRVAVFMALPASVPDLFCASLQERLRLQLHAPGRLEAGVLRRHQTLRCLRAPR